tara:strand:+ start:2882 stop:3070 length:189 start_codon:yes stop_codon:yes gene_type:complete
MGALNNLIKVVVGLILLIIAVWFSINFGDWGRALIDLIQGGIVLVVIFIGLILILLGFSDLK